MMKYIKHRKSLASESKSKDKNKKAGDVTPSSVHLHSSSEESSATPAGYGDSSSVATLTEDKVAQLIVSQIANLSESFATFVEVSFANIQAVIDDKLASHSNLFNRSFSAPLPVLVQPSPSQG